jgi:hypothetical protein
VALEVHPIASGSFAKSLTATSDQTPSSEPAQLRGDARSARCALAAARRSPSASAALAASQSAAGRRTAHLA